MIIHLNTNLTIKDNLLLDDRLRPQEIYLFLQLIRLCDSDTSTLTISAADLMKETRFTNKSLMLGYLKTLIQAGYIVRLDNVEKKATYKISNEHYFKR